MTTQDILELAARCEAATGPDRELDAAIAEALGLDHGRATGWSNQDNGDYWVIDECAAYFTESLDAAMTLVPEGMGCTVGRNIDGRGGGVVFNDPDNLSMGTGATSALALTAAALKARAHTKGEE